MMGVTWSHTSLVLVLMVGYRSKVYGGHYFRSVSTACRRIASSTVTAFSMADISKLLRQDRDIPPRDHVDPRPLLAVISCIDKVGGP